MQTILTAVADGVATVTLNDPDKRNALDADSAAALATSIRDLDADPDVRCLVLTGVGKGFCAGANLASLLDTAGEPAGAAELEARRGALSNLYAPFLALRNCRIPTLAAVNGAAVGAGLNLVLAADVAIAAESAKFLQGFLRIGLHPGGGNTSMLTERVGPQAAAAMTLFGETLDGRGAEAAGLVWRCVPDDELAAAAAAMAATCAGYPSAAAARVKETLRLARRADYASVLDAEITAQVWTTTLPETAERLAAARGGASR